MEAKTLLPLVFLLSACHTSAPTDASAPRDARADAAATDSGPPPFSLVFHDGRSNRLDADDRLPVDVGCQGGSHVFVGVTVEDALRAPTRVGLSFRLEGEPPGPLLELVPEERRPGRWELRDVMLVFSDVREEIEGSRPAQLTARVTLVGGEAVDRSVALRAVPGDVCATPCRYEDFPGEAQITEVTPPDAVGCAREAHGVAFDFEGDDGAAASASVSVWLAPDCRPELGVVEGGRVRALRRQLVSGACTPTLWSLVLDDGACGACP